MTRWRVFTKKRSIYNVIGWYRQLKSDVGSKALLALFICYTCLKGGLNIFVNNVMLAVYKRHGMHGEFYQLHSTVAYSPWAMKGIIGTTSDLFMIRGFKKRWYQIIITLLGIASCSALCITEFTETFDAIIIPLLPLPFFLINLQIATCDLLCEGRYAQIIRETNVGSSLVTFVWLSVRLGDLMGALNSGWILDFIGPGAIFTLMFILSAIPMWPWLLNYIGEEIKSGSCLKFDYDVWILRKKWFLFAVLMSIMSGIQILLSMVYSSTVLVVFSLLSSIINCTLQFKALPSQLSKVNIFMFCTEALYINLSGAMDYWYTANPECVRDGPHFSFTYFQTLGQSVGIIAGLFGLWAFQSCFSSVKYRTMFCVATLMKCFASITDFIIVKRWNIGWGMPDRILYLLGDSIVYPIVSMLSHMPAVMLTCELCPKNVESTAYALLAAFGNYGGVVSRHVGVYLLELFSVSIKGDKPEADINENETCQYDSLPHLIIIGHCILPMTTMILARFLIPDARMGQKKIIQSLDDSAIEDIPPPSTLSEHDELSDREDVHSDSDYYNQSFYIALEELKISSPKKDYSAFEIN